MAWTKIVALCEQCQAAYRGECDEAKHSQIKAHRRNADIWAQTHQDTRGHARFEFTETVSHFRIFGENPQMSLMEDPEIDLKDLV